jgi:hypothetical protein
MPEYQFSRQMNDRAPLKDWQARVRVNVKLVRDDKPICKLKTIVRNADGETCVIGTATTSYTMPLLQCRWRRRSGRRGQAATHIVEFAAGPRNHLDRAGAPGGGISRCNMGKCSWDQSRPYPRPT